MVHMKKMYNSLTDVYRCYLGWTGVEMGVDNTATSSNCSGVYIDDE